MKTVRFSKVVEKAGKPEVYLLLSETDEYFQKALVANRVLSLSGEGHGPEHGSVGYDKSRRGQLLIFPKSLKSFTGSKVVGIKYDLFDEPSQIEDKSSGDSRPTPTAEPKKAKTKSKVKSVKVRKVPRKAPPPKKVIPFAVEKKESGDEGIDALKTTIQKALRALEKGNSVAAYNLLKTLVGK